MERSIDKVLGCGVGRISAFPQTTNCGLQLVQGVQYLLQNHSSTICLWGFSLTPVDLSYSLLVVICLKGHVSAEEDMSDDSAIGNRHHERSVRG